MKPLLYITGMLPCRLANGTEIATRMIADSLSASGWDVTLAGFARPDDVVPKGLKTLVLDRIPIEFDEAAFGKKLQWMTSSVIRREPVSVTKFRSIAAEEKIREALRERPRILVDKPQMAFALSGALRGHEVGVIWHAIEHKTYGAVAQSSRGLKRAIYEREARLSKRMESSVGRWCARAHVLTESDKGALSSFMPPHRVETVPLSVPCPSDAARPDFRFDIGLLGNWKWSANADGLEWFASKILPSLQGRSFGLAGPGSNEFSAIAPQLSGQGLVPDARAFLSSCRVVAIPLISGTGVSMKVIEAASEGWPTVTTDVGARGLDHLPPNVHLAKSPAEFAVLCNQLLATDKATRLKWREAGRAWWTDRQRALAEAFA